MLDYYLLVCVCDMNVLWCGALARRSRSSCFCLIWIILFIRTQLLYARYTYGGKSVAGKHLCRCAYKVDGFFVGLFAGPLRAFWIAFHLHEANPNPTCARAEYIRKINEITVGTQPKQHIAENKNTYNL